MDGTGVQRQDWLWMGQVVEERCWHCETSRALKLEGGLLSKLCCLKSLLPKKPCRQSSSRCFRWIWCFHMFSLFHLLLEIIELKSCFFFILWVMPMSEFSATDAMVTKVLASGYATYRSLLDLWSFNGSSSWNARFSMTTSQRSNDTKPTLHRFQIRKILRGSFGRLDPTTRQRFTWCPDQVDGRDQPTAWTPLGQQHRWRFSTERAKCWSLLKKDELRAICWRLRRSSVWNLYLCIKI